MVNEIRTGYFGIEQVIIAVERDARPHEFINKIPKDEGRTDLCFFCPGNEHTTPKELARTEKKGGGWGLRVFQNKYPAVEMIAGQTNEKKIAYGTHEVIVESPEHGKSLGDLSEEEIGEYLELLIVRMKGMYSDERIRYVQIFKNHRERAGASIPHTHSQMISLEFIPKKIQERVQSTKKYLENRGECPVCKAAMQEMEGPRKILDLESISVFAPYAPVFPFETWLCTKRHVLDICGLNALEKKEMSKAIKKVLGAIKETLSDPPYNLIIMQSPKEGGLHLHIRIMPRISTWAGFEHGTDVVINTVAPEKAAEILQI